ncbi:MAG: methyltransferase RsmF C-terminal domain-like protein [Candidatus Bipolaricaulaceae bacterium]
MPSYDDRTEEALAFLAAHFGVVDLPGLVVEPDGDLWLTTAGEPPASVPCRAIGLRLLRRLPGGLKPTSFGLMALGDRIRRQRVELSPRQLWTLLHGRPLPYHGDASPGYVALCLNGEVVGCGLLQGGHLRCQIPTGRRRDLLNAMSAGHPGGV